jgi:hypothetical protein
MDCFAHVLKMLFTLRSLIMFKCIGIFFLYMNFLFFMFWNRFIYTILTCFHFCAAHWLTYFAYDSINNVSSIWKYRVVLIGIYTCPFSRHFFYLFLLNYNLSITMFYEAYAGCISSGQPCVSQLQEIDDKKLFFMYVCCC